MIKLKLTYLLLGFLIVSVKSKAQTDYVFYSNEEEELFKKAQNKEPYDTFKLLYFVEGKSVDEFNALEKKLNEFYAKNKETLSQTSKTKTYKYLHKEIQKTFFTKFVDSAQLPHLYRKGEYNCLMGTSIYTYFFQKMKVPYQVMEVPGHVYVKTNINGKEINFETTMPKEQGTYIVSVEEKQKFVDQLLESKIISSEDLVKKGYEKCYKDYWYDTSFLSMKSLAGMAYFNSASFAFENKNYNKAIEQYEKCKLFYNSKMTEYNISVTVQQQLQQNAATSEYQFEILKTITKYNKYLNKSAIEEYMQLYAAKLLLYNSNLADYSKLKPLIHKYFNSDSSYTSTVLNVYYGCLAEYYKTKQMVDSSLKYYLIAYSYKQNNLLVNSELANSIKNYVFLIENELEDIHSEHMSKRENLFLQGIKPSYFKDALKLDSIYFLNCLRKKRPIHNVLNKLDSTYYQKAEFPIQLIKLVYIDIFQILDTFSYKTNIQLTLDNVAKYIIEKKYLIGKTGIEYLIGQVIYGLEVRKEFDLMLSFFVKIEPSIAFNSKIDEMIKMAKVRKQMYNEAKKFGYF